MGSAHTLAAPTSVSVGCREGSEPRPLRFVDRPTQPTQRPSPPGRSLLEQVAWAAARICFVTASGCEMSVRCEPPGTSRMRACAVALPPHVVAALRNTVLGPFHKRRWRNIAAALRHYA